MKKFISTISFSVFTATLAMAIAPSCFAESKESKELAKAFALFQKGAYSQAIAEAKNIEGGSSELKGTVAFFIGNSYAKMQELDKAVPYFKKAINLHYETPSLHYDYGQALFAAHQLKEAEAEFKKSIVAQFKVGPSAYYVAFINELLENTAVAKDYYGRVQRLKGDPDKVKQPALYQLAEMERAQAVESNKNKRAQAKAAYQKALPLYIRARDFELHTAASDQADVKIKEIEADYNANAARMRNGNPMPTKPYTLKLTQSLGYDSNVTTQAENALIEVTNKDSFVSKTSMLSKYQWNFRDTFSVIPELSTTATYYLRRSTPKVYQNDNLSIGPAIRTKYEHMSRGKPATALMDVEFNLMLRDYLQQHRMPFYSRYFNFVFGERVTWLKTGSSTLKAQMKFYESYDPARNFFAPLVSFQQNVKLFGQWDLSNTLSAEYTHARDDINDETNYKLAQSITLTRLFEKVDVTPALTLNVKDPMKQKGTRGNEFLFNPSIEFGRNFVEWLETTVNYGYTKNFSKSKTAYQYSKHELTFAAAHSF